MEAVLFKVTRADLENQQASQERNSVSADDENHSRNETSKVILDSLGSLIATHLDRISKTTGFDALWVTLIDILEDYIDFQSHDLNAAVYSFLTTVLTPVENNSTLGQQATEKAVGLWNQCLPQRRPMTSSKRGNQDAFVSYVRSWNELYRLVEKEITASQVQRACANLLRCVEESDGQTYSADIDHLTELQAEVLKAVNSIRIDTKGVPPLIINFLGDLVSLPFDKEKKALPTSLTFIAISKAAMDYLVAVVTNIKRDREIFPSGALVAMLKSLIQPIARKYSWGVQGKHPTIWRKATTTAVNLLKETIANAAMLSIEPNHMKALWEQVVNLANAVGSADCSAALPSTPITEDETFDIDSLSIITELMKPALGATFIPDSLRRVYAASLFRISIIHPLEPFELRPSDTEPLKHLYDVRFGRTYDPPPSPRSRMAYFCLLELVSLAARRDGSDALVRLAQAAAPFLIARAALPLKAFIADQPLRGRMPQPSSQRLELLFVLKGMRELNSEEAAIPEAEGIRSSNKRHLHMLYPLIPRAINVAAGGTEVLEELSAVVAAVGDGFRF